MNWIESRLVVLVLIAVVGVAWFSSSCVWIRGRFTVVRSATIVLMHRLGNRDLTVKVYYYTPQYVPSY